MITPLSCSFSSANKLFLISPVTEPALKTSPGISILVAFNPRLMDQYDLAEFSIVQCPLRLPPDPTARACLSLSTGHRSWRTEIPAPRGAGPKSPTREERHYAAGQGHLAGEGRPRRWGEASGARGLQYAGLLRTLGERLDLPPRLQRADSLAILYMLPDYRDGNCKRGVANAAGDSSWRPNLLPCPSQEWSISSFPCSLTRDKTSHIMKNLAFPSLFRWRIISLYLTYTFLFRKVVGMFRTFWTWEWKGLCRQKVLRLFLGAWLHGCFHLL